MSIPGGQALQYNTSMFMRWRLKDQPVKGEVCYHRIYDTEDTRNHEPIGILAADWSKKFWLKINGEELLRGKFVAKQISQAEFESDIAFGLFPVMKANYRPIRSWLQRRQWHFHVGCLIGAFTSVNLIAEMVVDHRWIAVPCLLTCVTSIACILGRYERSKWWRWVFDMGAEK